MAKVTITIQDVTKDGREGADIYTEFDPPITAEQQDALSEGSFEGAGLTNAQLEGIAYVTAQSMSGAELIEAKTLDSNGDVQTHGPDGSNVTLN